MGLRQKILTVKTEKEVEKLLAEGKTYQFASTKTRNAWKNAGRRVLGLPAIVLAPKETVARKKKAKKKKDTAKKEAA
jgi:hypothetical protein